MTYLSAFSKRNKIIGFANWIVQYLVWLEETSLEQVSVSRGIAVDQFAMNTFWAVVGCSIR